MTRGGQAGLALDEKRDSTAHQNTLDGSLRRDTMGASKGREGRMSQRFIGTLEVRRCLSTLTIGQAPVFAQPDGYWQGNIIVRDANLSLTEHAAGDAATFLRGKLKVDLLAVVGTFEDKPGLTIAGAEISTVARTIKATFRQGRMTVFTQLLTNDGQAIPPLASQRLISVDASKVKSVVITYGRRSISSIDGPQFSKLVIDSSFPASTVFLSTMNDLLIANHQPNTIYGGSGDDTIYAGGGDDVVYGEEGSDRLFGEGGDDTLFGGAHKDYLDGGSGKNILVGGSGTDYFSVRSKDKTDREDRDRVTVID